MFLAEDTDRLAGHVKRWLRSARRPVSVCPSASRAFHVYHTVGLVFLAEDAARLVGCIVHWLLFAQRTVSVLPSAAAGFYVNHTIGLVFCAEDTDQLSRDIEHWVLYARSFVSAAAFSSFVFHGSAPCDAIATRAIALRSCLQRRTNPRHVSLVYVYMPLAFKPWPQW
jgi:hypothetical protein